MAEDVTGNTSDGRLRNRCEDRVSELLKEGRANTSGPV